MTRHSTPAAVLSMAVILLLAVAVLAASVQLAQAGPSQQMRAALIPDPAGPAGVAAAPVESQGPGLNAIVDLAISKLYLGPKSEPGKHISFRIYYTNTSGVSTDGPTFISDTLPLGTSYAATLGAPLPPSVSYVGGQAQLLYNVGILGAGVGSFFDIDTFISQTTQIGTWLTNTAEILPGGLDSDSNLSNNSTAAATLVVGAELAITKTAPAFVTAGDLIPYVINVNNSGNQSATSAVITDRLPGGVTFLPPSLPPHSAWSGDVITWSNGITVGTGATYTIRFTATAPLSTAGNVLVNTAAVSQTSVNENNYDNNVVTVTTQITGTPNFQLSKSDGGMTGSAGGLITYTIFYTNAGTGAAFDTVITESVPLNTTFWGPGGIGGWQFISGRTYVYNLGTVPAIPCPPPVGTTCKQGSVPFIVRVDSPFPAGVNVVTNTATIWPGNMSATDTTPITGTVDLQVSKNHVGVPVPVSAGSRITFTINYLNTGTKGASGVLLTETLPANTTYAGGNWTLVSGVYVKAIGPLAVNTPGQTQFIVTVNPTLPIGVNSIVNTIIIDDDHTNGADLTPSNNQATDTVPVNAVPDLVVVKSDGGVTASPSDTINYTIFFSNTGSRPATNVVLTDTVGPGYLTASDTTGWSQVGPAMSTRAPSVRLLRGPRPR